jgi:hypothetical protein
MIAENKRENKNNGALFFIIAQNKESKLMKKIFLRFVVPRDTRHRLS